MERDGLGSAFLRVELLRRQLLRPHFIELGLTVGQGQPRILKTLRLKGAMSQRELFRPLCARCHHDVENS